jgi:zonular occludens toxin Zot
MITLITGSLGTGKTAFAIKLFTEHTYYPDNAVIVGVREWQGGGAYYPLKSMQDARANQKTIEEIGGLSGTIYFVDEAKKIWPSRIAGKPTPEFIDSHLAESRSIAQDWILTAQTPTQIDVALRRLVGRHIHLERNALGVKYSESGQIRDDPKFTRDESRKYSFPVESLKLNKSDDGVTDLQKKGLRMPKRLILLGSLILFLIAFIGYFISQFSMFGLAAENLQEEEITSKNKMTSGFMQTPQRNNQQKGEVLPISLAPSINYYMPRDPAFPEIARAPCLPLSCLKGSETECVCYDQYQQRIEGFPVKRCSDIINGLNPFAFALKNRDI